MATEQSSKSATAKKEGLIRTFLKATELDVRILGMLGALVLVWCVFDVLSGLIQPNASIFNGLFLTPRSLWTLLVQTSSIAVMATGMVLVIVMRQIDLSVGSMLSMLAVAGAMVQVFALGPLLGVGHPIIWIAGVATCLVMGTLVGVFNGVLTAYLQIPSFIVTLGGLIAYSGIAFLLASGVTIAPLDQTYDIIGGGVPQSWLGPMWSWVLGLAACALIV